jgi:hypothetical protein
MQIVPELRWFDLQLFDLTVAQKRIHTTFLVLTFRTVFNKLHEIFDASL